MTSQTLIEVGAVLGVLSTLVAIVGGLVGLVKVIKEQGRLEGMVTTTLANVKESLGAVWKKVDVINDTDIMTHPDHQVLCGGVTRDFNRQIQELGATMKQYQAENQADRERNIRILSRLETLLDERMGKGRRAEDYE